VADEVWLIHLTGIGVGIGAVDEEVDWLIHHAVLLNS
jgi:hypothetical protein